MSKDSAPLGLLAPLVLDFDDDEAPTRPDCPKPALSAADSFALRRLERNWLACSPEDRRLIQALAVRLRPGAED